jgi:hypothetical protein
MATEADLEEARTALDSAYQEALGRGQDPRVQDAYRVALYEIDEFPLDQQVNRLRQVTAALRQFAAGETTFPDLPSIP